MRLHHINDILNLDIQKLVNFEKVNKKLAFSWNQLWLDVYRVVGDVSLCVSAHRPLPVLSLSLSLSLSHATVCSLNIEQHIWIIKWPFSMNTWKKLLLQQYVLINDCKLLTESSSCLWVANTQATCSNESPRPSEEVLHGLCHPQSVDLSNTTLALKRLINKLPETHAVVT